MPELITIHTFPSLSDLNIACSRLESEGIQYFVQNELTTLILPVYAAIDGGAKLQVKPEDAERAIVILEEMGYIKPEDLQPTKMEKFLYKLFSRIPLLKRIYKN